MPQKNKGLQGKHQASFRVRDVTVVLVSIALIIGVGLFVLDSVSRRFCPCLEAYENGSYYLREGCVLEGRGWNSGFGVRLEISNWSGFVEERCNQSREVNADRPDFLKEKFGG